MLAKARPKHMTNPLYFKLTQCIDPLLLSLDPGLLCVREHADPHHHRHRPLRRHRLPLQGQDAGQNNDTHNILF